MIDRQVCVPNPDEHKSCNITTSYAYQGIIDGQPAIALTANDLSGQLCYINATSTSYNVTTYWDTDSFFYTHSKDIPDKVPACKTVYFSRRLWSS